MFAIGRPARRTLALVRIGQLARLIALLVVQPDVAGAFFARLRIAYHKRHAGSVRRELRVLHAAQFQKRFRRQHFFRGSRGRWRLCLLLRAQHATRK